MKIEVDYNRCTGHGFCEAIDEDDQRTRIDEAVKQCPTVALSLRD